MSSLLLHPRLRGAVAAFAASALAFGTAGVLLGAESGNASSHRESPLLLADPQADNTDVYAYVADDRPGHVTFIANWLPFEEPAGGPNFYPFADGARHYINIDNDGDAKPDIRYRWTFKSRYLSTDTFLYATGPVTSLTDPNLNYRQTYTLQRVGGGGAVRTLARNIPVAPSNVGAASMPNYTALSNAAIRSFGEGRRTFAGQADDAFFLDLRVFDLLYGGDLSETGNDTLTGFNVNTIALQVPKADLIRNGDPVIGVWSTTERRSVRVQGADGSQSYSGKYVQVSRLGNPLVNEVVIPVGLKDAFNALKPENDADVPAAVDKVLNPEVPKLIDAIYGIPEPKTPRRDLFRVFLTGLEGLNRPDGAVRPAELLRLNTSIPPSASPNRLGVLAGDNAGFPNGRRLIDDVVDIELQALEGAVRTGTLIPALTDAVDTNDLPFRPHFPYVALPHSGSDAGPAVSSTGPAAQKQQLAPNRRDGDRAAELRQGESDNGAPVALIAVTGGLALGVLGTVLMRRGRRQIEI